MRHQELLALGIFNSRSHLGDRIELLLRRGRTFSPRVSMARVAVSAVALLGSFVASAFAPRLLAFAQPPAFDAASVKPNTTPRGGREIPGGGSLRFTPGRVTGTRVTARRIILEAYHLTEYQLSGGPGWVESDRFDIEGKAATPADRNQLRQMLQPLLAERFKLVVRHETKEMPVCALVVAKNGSKLHEVKPGDPTPAPSNDHPGRGGTTNHMFDLETMQEFADSLSRNSSFDRPVLNKTGLQGTYLISLEWGSDEDYQTAIEEQLGLKFESQKAPMDTIVIDHIEKPDPN
jgi:uncharacterized protein (TIGR03435 family)